MGEKAPRLRPIERVNRQPLNADQQRHLGQLSLGVGPTKPPVPPKEPSCNVFGVGEEPNRDLAEVMEILDNS